MKLNKNIPLKESQHPDRKKEERERRNKKYSHAGSKERKIMIRLMDPVERDIIQQHFLLFFLLLIIILLPGAVGILLESS